MNCTRPTIANVYKVLGIDKQLVRYNYYREFYDIEGLKKEVGSIEEIKATDKEIERYGLQKEIYYPAVVTGSYIIPCGKCPNCIKEYKHNKANRIYLDYLQCLEENPTITGHFLTLTYDNDHLPINQNLNKLSLENVIHKIKKIDPNTKYYAVGEYGGKTLRPHYHIIIWNERINWGKLTLIKRGKKWNNYKIENPTIWDKGEVTVAPIAPENISYVVGYSNKKLNRTKEEKEELKKNHIQAEFNIQSRNIAHNYYEAHKDQIESHKGKIYEHGRTITTDRSFKKFLENNNYPIPEYITEQSNIINMSYTIKDNLLNREETERKLNKENRNL